MTATLRRLSANDSLDAIEQALKDDGGVIVEGLLASDVIERIKAEAADARARANPGMKHLNPAIQFFYGDKTRHVNGMAAQSRTFATEVMIHPLYLALCDRILLPSCARYQLNLGHLIDRGPGAEAQLLHRDEVVCRGDGGRAAVELPAGRIAETLEARDVGGRRRSFEHQDHRDRSQPRHRDARAPTIP